MKRTQKLSQARVEWAVPNNRTKAAWANTDDAIRDGAYALAIAAVALHKELFAIRRAETRTGADYYISATQNLDDLEQCVRLEVSGIHLDIAEVKRRLRLKREQVQQGNSHLPALVAIVGFRVQLVLLAAVEQLAMSWLDHHSRSEEYARQAEALMKEDAGDRAIGLYWLAADAEQQALEVLEPQKTRTLGITVISTVALYDKARELKQAKAVAYQWLSTDLLSPFAIEELESLLRVLLTEEAQLKQVANV